MVSLNTKTLLEISFIKGVGTRKLLSLKKLHDIQNYSLPEIIKNHLYIKNITDIEIDTAIENAKAQINIASNFNHKIISFFDESYPKRLDVMPDAPPILFCSGNIDLLHSRNVTVIGTRKPTEHGELICQKITKWLVDNNFNIISGLALGIDAIAHNTCLENNGHTIAVLANGLEKISPKSNEKLGYDIAIHGGLLVTEYKYNSFISKGNFIQRDKIQAALGSGVFLIQSGENGGSLHASRAILEYQKPLVVVGQSKTDFEQKNENCMANINLLSGDSNLIRKTLKIDNFNQSLIIPLMNKLEYDFVLDIILAADKCTSQNRTDFGF